MSVDFHLIAPPWGQPAVWREANQTVDYLIRIHRPDMDHVIAMAREIRYRLESIFPLMDELCSVACAWCSDRCCLRATVWIDFRDILFLHLNGLQIPPAQLIQDTNDTCCYTGHRGCTLPRLHRPWVCTCYLCPPHMTNLRKKDRPAQNRFNQTVRTIKTGRKEMEDEFIRVISEKTEAVGSLTFNLNL
ncbi:hypothetical protein QUF72_13665 [Desulfobacterales bacterium HSG2]|nr:hypothetical protein [Desulfobacterales bacterium HSG2]